VAGNHDWCEYNKPSKISLTQELEKRQVEFKVTILENESIKIDGINFYGTPELVCEGWAFSHNEHQLINYYELIPKETQVLITHTPPIGILDLNKGSYSLSKRIQELPNLRYHIFGHIHEEWGKEKIGKIEYINCSIGYKHNFRTVPLQIEF
jgi:Icc-related predicted phosphoesterase